MYDFGGPNDKGTYLDHGMCEWWGKDGRPTDRVTKMSFHQKFRWDFTNGSRAVSCDPAIRYSGFFGVRSVGHVGNFLEISNIREISPSLRRMGDLRANFPYFFVLRCVFFLRLYQEMSKNCVSKVANRHCMRNASKNGAKTLDLFSSE